MKRGDTNGKGLVLYEQVLQKNFQIIQTFLNKFPVIFKKQDYFDQTIKKINEKLVKFDQESDKFRQQVNLTTSLLDKKIVHLKENSIRNNRSSMRASQQIGPMDQRKNSIFRISSSFKTNEFKQNGVVFSKEKMELLNEMDKKQQESKQRMEQIQNTITQMQERLNFVSVISGKMEQSMDKVLQEKLDKQCFLKLEKQYEHKFQDIIHQLADQKYKKGQKFIEQQFDFLQDQFKQQIKNDLAEVKKKLLGQLEKKAAVTQFRQQLRQIKSILEKMVEESIDSFASKDETKLALTLFEKKMAKFELILQEVLNQTLKEGEQEKLKNSGAWIGFRKQKDGLMNSFGRKRRADK